MTFSYNQDISPASGTPIDAIRFLIQDTDSSAPELADEEITALYNDTATTYGTTTTAQAQRVYVTALECAKTLHTRYSKQSSFSSAGTSIQLLERAKYWHTVVQGLADLSYGGITVIYSERNSALW